MMNQNDPPRPLDPGLAVLVTLLRFQGIGADPEQIRHRMGGVPIGIPEMLRCAKDLGLKARARTTSWDRLPPPPPPRPLPVRDGGVPVFGKGGGGQGRRRAAAPS